jgi:hypothetical protein
MAATGGTSDEQHRPDVGAAFHARPGNRESSPGEGLAMLEVIARTQLWTGFTAVIAALVIVLILL